MLYHRDGFPEEDDIVLCTVKNVQYHSVFVSLDHYGDKTGLIHISEVSPGRIRNIRDFVVEGKKVWCKVLRISQEKGHIDLSLRRVNESQKRLKNDQMKQEQRAEKIIETYAVQNSMKPEEAYNAIAGPILKEYLFVHEAFNEVVESGLELDKLGIKNAEPLTKIIIEKITPKTFTEAGTLTVKSFDEDGLETSKAALKEACINESVVIKYTGGGNYSITITSHDHKETETLMKQAIDACRNAIEKTRGICEFTAKKA